MKDDDRIARFLAAIHAATPTGQWIAVQHHPDGDWSVAAQPLPWLPGMAFYGATIAPLAPDVRRLVIAARAFIDQETIAPGNDEEHRELNAAAEAFASRVPWDDEPEDELGPKLAGNGR